MKTIGSQKRETLEESGYKVISFALDWNGVVLEDETGKREYWAENNDFAGYVIEIDGKGYEFVSDVPEDPDKLISKVEVLSAVDAEPEYPDEMPEDVRNVLIQAINDNDIALLTGAFRITVQLTKRGIRERIEKIT